MKNNDYLRSLRYILNISDAKMLEIVHLSEKLPVTSDIFGAYLKAEEDPQFLPCPDLVMLHFLEGMIFYLRGKDPNRPALPLEPKVTNNLVLKKTKVAFKLTEEDILKNLGKIGFKISRSELSALFRNSSHHNYRVCGDQFLRNFFKSLAQK